MPHEYEEKISYYKSLVEKLLKDKGLKVDNFIISLCCD
jgi:hypothetical protein